MSLQDTASTAGILAELNNRLTSYESTIRELRSKNRDFVNRLRDSQQIRKDLCIKVNSLQNDLEKRDKELKIQKDQNKQLKKRVTNLNDLNSNYQSKIEELKIMCEQLRNNNKSQFANLNDHDNSKISTVENKNSQPTSSIDKKQTKFSNSCENSINIDNIRNNDTVHNTVEIEDSTKNNAESTSTKTNSTSNKSLLVKEGDLKFSVEEISDENMKYIPVSDDPIDRAIATFTNSRKNKIFFTRVKQGTYVYGRLMVEAKLVTKPGIDKNKPLLRIVSRGKLYTLADFVNTHEDEELNNIENSLRTQNSCNLGPSEGQTLVVASPISKFRTSSNNQSISHPNAPQSISTSTGIHHYMQSPITFSSNRIQVIDSKQPQGMQLQSYVMNYPTSINEIATSQKNNSLASSTFYGNLNSIQQLSPINKNSSFGIQQLSSLLPNQQYSYYQISESIPHINHQYKSNINYSASGPTLITPPPIAEYMPVTTPIIMNRQPVNTLGNNTNITSPTSIANNDSKIIHAQTELGNLSHEKQVNEIKKSISSPSILGKISKENCRAFIENGDQLNTDNSSEFRTKSLTQSVTPAKHSKDNIKSAQIYETNSDQQKASQSQKNACQMSPIKSVSASTIGEWYRQANIMKKFNSCENFFASSNKR